MKFYKILILSLFLTSLAHSDIRREFPSYNYILTEFDLDESFIDNPTFQRFVQKNKNEYRVRFIKAMKRGDLIVPTLRKILEDHDMSYILLYISMMESNFKPDATSRTGAAGLWQIAENTAPDLKLKMNSSLDERYDPIKSTNAAIGYLNRINGNLNKWYLTTMAYNCGMGCVQKSLKRAGTDDLSELINPRNNYIREETRDYIQRILLMAMIGENYLFSDYDSIGEMVHRINDDKITAVQVRSGEKLSSLASILNMNRVYLDKINIHLKNGRTPNGYRMNIPTSKVAMFNARYAANMRQNNKYARR